MDSKKILLCIKATTKAASNKIGNYMIDNSGNKILKIYVTAVPENGKANKAIINLLSKEWNIAKSNIEIVKGEHDTSKIIAFCNLTAQQIEQLSLL
jgi:uncharacterized protein (TIGR00251 family)